MHACKSDAAFWQPVTVLHAVRCCLLQPVAALRPAAVACVRPAGAVCCNLLRPTACALSPLFAASAAAACLQPAAAFACSLFLSACSPLLLAVCCGCCCNLLRLLLQPAGATCLQHAVLSAACCRGCCMWPADADCSQPVMLFVQRDVLRCSLLLLPHACNLPLFCMQATVACCNLLLLYSLLQLLQPAGAAACSLLGLIAAACCRSVCNLLLPCCLPTVDVLHTAAGCCLQPVLRYSLTAACLQTADAVCLQPTDATCLQSADAAVCGLSAACLQSAAVLFAACCCCCLLAACRCSNMQSAAACQQPVLPHNQLRLLARSMLVLLLAACICCLL